MITKDQVVQIAKQILDPEIPCNLWDLGLLYEIQVDSQQDIVQIKMTLTSQGHPEKEKLPGLLKAKIEQELHPREVTIELVYEPLWTPDLLTEDGKRRLGIDV